MDHSHDHAHNHSGGHGHSHDHGHDHSHDGGEYYLNQLLLVFICGAFGVVAVLLYQTLNNINGGMMGKLLAPRFQLPVLLGGIALLAVVVVRGVCLWKSAGQNHHHHDQDHGHHHHDHKPGEKCDNPEHDHAKCEEPGHVHDEKCGHHHGHDHGDHSAEDHEHGSVYWRVVILAFPIFLFLMGVPSRGFSARWIAEYLGEEEALAISSKEIADSGQEALYDFKSLNDQSKRPEARAELIGRRATLSGQFAPVGGREFSLVFLSMTCCPADKEPLRARILAQEESQIAPYRKEAYPWVQVSGIISEFVQSPKTGEWVAIIRVDKPNGVQRTDPRN